MIKCYILGRCYEEPKHMPIPDLVREAGLFRPCPNLFAPVSVFPGKTRDDGMDLAINDKDEATVRRDARTAPVGGEKQKGDVEPV